MPFVKYRDCFQPSILLVVELVENFKEHYYYGESIIDIP